MSRKRSHHRSRKPPRIRRLTSPGTTPGTVEVAADAAQPSIRVITYDDDELVETVVTDVAQLRDLLEEDAVNWVHVDGLGNVAMLHELSEIFGLHGLALEDVVNMHQRAKVEEYGDHLFIVLRMVLTGEHVHGEQLSMFLGRNFVLTLQQHPCDCLDPVRDRLRKARGRIRETGPDYLAYAVIDCVVDAYFPVVDECGERIEQMDEEITTGYSPNYMESLHGVRTDLMALRRAIRPLRDALVLLMPDPHALIGEETQFYLRDCFDHVIQLIDLVDTYRELCGNLRDYHLSVVNNHMNEIMKVLTIIATIFIPLSFIAGVYGMNFNTAQPGNMPELNWPYGYFVALGVMATTALSLLWFIWWRGWLKARDW